MKDGVLTNIQKELIDCKQYLSGTDALFPLIKYYFENF